MDNGDITKYIIAELRKYRNPDDIIAEVCEMSGMKWADAQQFVERVQSVHGAEITGLRNPQLVVLTIGAIVVGLGLLIGPTVAFRVWSSEAFADFVGNFIVLGLTMIIGGIIGLFRAAYQ